MPYQQNVLTRLKNYNNVLTKEFFGNIDKYANNWQQSIGSIYEVKHHDFKESIKVEFVGMFLVVGTDIEKEMDYPIFSSCCPPTTIRQLCGFDDETFYQWRLSCECSTKGGCGLYVFKNLNYNKKHL